MMIIMNYDLPGIIEQSEYQLIYDNTSAGMRDMKNICEVERIFTFQRPISKTDVSSGSCSCSCSACDTFKFRSAPSWLVISKLKSHH